MMLRQEDGEFEASLNFIARPVSKKENKEEENEEKEKMVC
jgi:hypothetical protein